MRPELAQALAPYRMRMPRGSLRGPAGERLGAATGASLEYMDHREYCLGDDLRHIDWRAYARSDKLELRLYREEISPWFDLVVDVSASMESTPLKSQALQDLVDAFRSWALQAGGKARVLLAGGEELEHGSLTFTRGPADILSPRVGLRPGSLRIIVSDFLIDIELTQELRALASHCPCLYVIQLLDPWEASPTAEGPRSLVDAESGERLSLDLSSRAIERYRSRLAALGDEVERATRALGGLFAPVIAADPTTMFRESLLPRGILEPVH